MERLNEKTLDNAAKIVGKEDRAGLDHLLEARREPTRALTPYTF
ncbi:hypothetical protein [Streptomyces sp. NPDC006784]